MGSFLCQGKRAVSLIRIHELMGLFFGASQDDVDQLIAQVRERLSSSAEMFQADAAHLPSPSEILSQAMDQLSELAASALKDGNTPNSQDVLEENGRLRRRVEELTRRSTIDPLTHVFNRGYLTERLAEQVAVARLRQQRIGLIFIDVDHFKAVNDTYGHAAGDRVLERVARSIESVIRTTDVLGRYGGEEFIVLTGSGDIAGLGCVGERIRAQIAEERIECDGQVIPVTASLGGALMGPPVEGDDLPQRLIDCADAAMYMAKRNGRNQFVLIHENEQGQQETVMPQG
jgi:diguanylate cyclase (GGDEF)-like protein